MPSRVKTAPWPLLKRGLFSRRVTAWVAVSRAVGRELDVPVGEGVFWYAFVLLTCVVV